MNLYGQILSKIILCFKNTNHFLMSHCHKSGIKRWFTKKPAWLMYKWNVDSLLSNEHNQL